MSKSILVMATPKTCNSCDLCGGTFHYYCKANYRNIVSAYERADNKGAMFDARCFNIPKEEVCNLIYWRQLDAARNSIQMVGQANFSHKELQNKSCNNIQDIINYRPVIL